ncbi:MAG: DMT family transporter [bacterium]
MKPDERQLTVEFLIICSVSIFGLNYPILKYILGTIDPYLANAVRMILGFSLLFSYYCWRISDPFGRALRVIENHWFLIIIVGLVGYYLSPIFYLTGMARSSASNASIILASALIWTVVFSWWFDLDHLSKRGWLALLITLSGCLLVGVLPRDQFPTTRMLIGNILLLIDAELWGLFIVLNKRLMQVIEPLEATVWSLLFALLPLVLTADLLTTAGPADLADGGLILALLFSGFLSMGLAQLWYNLGVDALGPARAGIYGNGIPVIGLFSSVIFLGEPLSLVKIVGVCLILVGVLLLRTDLQLELIPVPGKTPVT